MFECIGGKSREKIRGPAATTEELQEMLASSDIVPSRSEIMGVLGQIPNTRSSTSGRQRAYSQLFGSNGSKGAAETHSRYELITSELVTELAKYLISRAEELGDGGRPVRVLELGAGEGKLARHLGDRLEFEKPAAFEVKAIDDGSWNIPSLPIVEKRDVTEALTTERPNVVIMSWPSDDWTPLVRAQASVQEYLLIGDPAFCGTSPKTGYGAYGRSLVYGREPKPNIWPEDNVWQRDGFTHHILEDISAVQMGYNWAGMEDSSKTISFRRH